MNYILSTTYYIVYLSVLFTKDEPKLMELINQLPLDVQSETKHFIQKIEESWKIKVIQNMLRKNAEIIFICDVMDVSEDFVHDIREKMPEE